MYDLLSKKEQDHDKLARAVLAETDIENRLDELKQAVTASVGVRRKGSQRREKAQD